MQPVIDSGDAASAEPDAYSFITWARQVNALFLFDLFLTITSSNIPEFSVMTGTRIVPVFSSVVS